MLTLYISQINRIKEANFQTEEVLWVELEMIHLIMDMVLSKTTASLEMSKIWTWAITARIPTQLPLGSTIQRTVDLLIKIILWMKHKADSCRIFKTTDQRLSMVELQQEITAFSKTISYFPRQVQMQECLKHFTIVSNQHLVLEEVPQDLQVVVWMVFQETFIITIQTTAATVRKEQFKEWKCIYENRNII